MGYCFHHLLWYQLRIQWCYCFRFIKGSITPPAETVDIAVSVSDKTSEDPIAGASVTITDTTDSSITFTGTSGSAGGCTLSEVPLGTYTVEATKEGYTDYEDEITVTAETTTLAIIMEEAGDWWN